MKIHCFNKVDLAKALTNSSVQVGNELIKVAFKDVEVPSKPDLVFISKWTYNCKATSADIKNALFDLGVPVVLIDNDTKEVVVEFQPKNHL